MSNLISFEDEKAEENPLDIFDPLSSRSKSDDDLHNLSFPGDTPLPPIPTPTNIPSQDHHFAKPKLPERRQSLMRRSNYSYPSPSYRSSFDATSLSSADVRPIEIIHPIQRPHSIGSHRYSGLQEPDSPSTCLAYKITRTRSKFKFDDLETNSGIIYAPLSSKISHCADIKVLVKLSNGSNLPNPLIRSLDSSIQDLIKMIRLECSVRQFFPQIEHNNFILQIDSTNEFLSPKMFLHSLFIVRHCLKLNKSLKLTCVELDSLYRPFSRSADDDVICQTPPYYITTSLKPHQRVSDQELRLILELCNKKCDDLLAENHESAIRVRFQHLEQSVKALVAKLAQVETSELSTSIIRLQTDLNNPNQLYLSIEKLKDSIHDLISLYQNNSPEFSDSICDDSISIEDIIEPVSIQIISLHQIPAEPSELVPPNTTDHIDSLWMALSITRGDGASCCRKVATGKSRILRSMFPRVIWNQKLTLDIEIKNLPLDASLLIELYCTATVPDRNIEKEIHLSSKKISIFDFRRKMLSGRQLIKLTSIKDRYEPVLYIELSDLKLEFPEVQAKKIILPEIQKDPVSDAIWENVSYLLNRTFLSDELSDDQKSLIWDNRYLCYQIPDSLPLVLSCCPKWSTETLGEVSGLLTIWPLISSLVALRLLTEEFASIQTAREFAIKCLLKCNDKLLFSILPQLIAALEYEIPQDGAICDFIVHKSLSSVAFGFIAHRTLNAAIEYKNLDVYRVTKDLLEWAVGSKMSKILSRSSNIHTAVDATGENIKTAKGGDIQSKVSMFEELHDQLDLLKPFYLNHLLPFQFNGLKTESCSVFSSFTAPMKLVFEDINGGHHKTMFKIGDDLRQDQLITSFFSLFEDIWLDSGLDLRMRYFQVIPTAKSRGFIELVDDSVTLREIQSGLDGSISMSETNLHNYLVKQRLDHHQLVDNFTRSCAGYCVATYILGLGDRHNDNIMVTRQGHLFHIDFNKAFGHAQMFAGAIKRDRAPFVLSEDMAYVINHGDKTGRSFHHFVDLCTKAYNLIRVRWHDVLSLLYLSLPMGLTTLKGTSELKYILANLSPTSDTFQAQQTFTKLIKESHGNISVKLNFWVHTAAQWVSNGNAGVAPLPQPERKTVSETGRPMEFQVDQYEKRVRTSIKYFVYRIKVNWPTRVSYIYRTWEEFMQYKEQIIQRLPKIDYPEISSLADPSKTNNQTIEMAQYRLESIFTFLAFVQRPENNDIREHTATISFLFEEEKFIPKKSDSLPVAITGGKIKLQFNLGGNRVRLLIEHCQDLPTIHNTAPEPYVKTYLLDSTLTKINGSKKKTPTSHRTCHPTFNNLIEYHEIDLNLVQAVHISVWSYSISGNAELGKFILNFDQQKQNGWFPLNSKQTPS